MATEAEMDKADLETVMRSEAGRRVVQRLLDETGVDRTVLSKDHLNTAYLSGKRDIGLWLERQLRNGCPDQYLTLIKENLNNA